mmetsp:Transcript_14864/g.25335  ORF Transcript_14864/g.25335 Transcript_14864/m.25335 type:complete len:1270 (-) Transcript_14864:150-3959(-)
MSALDKPPKLNFNNHSKWKSIIIPYLLENDIKTDTENDTPKNENKGLRIIRMSVNDSILPVIQNLTTVKETLDTLESKFGAKDPKLRQRKMVQFFQEKKLSNENINEYIGRITGIYNEINSLKAEGVIELNDEILKSKIISGLDISHQEEILSWPESEISITNIGIYFNKINLSQDGYMLNINKKKKNSYCKYCKKKGHNEKNCFKKNNKSRATALYTNYNDIDSNWYLDSGCSHHITGDASQILEFYDDTINEKFSIADNTIIHVNKHGKCRVFGNPKCLYLKDVYFSNDIKKNLISISMLIKDGFDVKFSKHKCDIFKNNNLILSTNERDGTYKIPIKQLNVVNYKDDLIIHKKFGHASRNALNNMGIKIGKINCKECINAELVKTYSKSTSKIRAKYVNEYIHTDICGPFPQSFSGMKYLISFTDDYSRYTKVYFMNNKKEVFSKLKCYLNEIFRHNGKKTKFIKSDNGMEYKQTKVKNILQKYNVKQIFTTVYSPQQNGVAERINRTLCKGARSLLLNFNLPVEFWAEALNCASYLNNIKYNTTTKNIPFFVVNNFKPFYNDLHIFGCKAYVRIPKSKRNNKLSPQALEVMFLGYDYKNGGWKFLNPKTNTIIYSKDARFVDNESGYTEKYLNNDYTIIDTIIQELDNEINDNEVNYENNVEINNDEIDEIDNNYEINETDNNDEIDEIDETENNDEIDETENNDANEVDKPIHPLDLKTKEKFEEEAKKQNINIKNWSKNDIDNKLQENYYNYKQQKRINQANIIIPKTYSQAMESNDKSLWIKSMKEEFDSILEHDVLEKAKLPNNKKLVDTKWVYDLKKDHEGNIIRYKSRLVAKGYSQIEGVDYNQVFSPVIRPESIRLLFNKSIVEKWKMEQVDIKTAFLNGTLEEEIYIRLPPGLKESGQVFKLRKALYGLKQAAKAWNDILIKFFKENNFQQLINEPCIVISDKIIAAIYVDDIIFLYKEKSNLNQLLDKMKEKFTIKQLGEPKLLLGVHIQIEKDQIIMDQSQYIKEILEEFNMKECNSVNTPIDKVLSKSKEEYKGNFPYRQLVGKLNYLVNWTRPDICYAVSRMSKFLDKPGKEQILTAKKTLKYLKSTIDKKFIINPKSNKIEMYCDASWADDIDNRKSTSGYCLYYGRSLISWKTKSQPVVSLSTMEAEFYALSLSITELQSIIFTVKELKLKTHDEILIYEDNQPCIAYVKGKTYHSRAKHIDIKYRYLQETFNNKQFKIVHCSTNEMIADGFTKPLSRLKYEEFRSRLNVV